MWNNITEEVRHTSGGSPVNVEMAPYSVVVRGENTGALCTGTLITLEIVLTLARCFYQGYTLNETDSSVEILAGVDTLANISVEGRTQSRRGNLLNIHPNFRPTSTEPSFGYNDIALISIEAFEQTPTVRAISLGFLDWGKNDLEKCKVTSYGAVNPVTPSTFDDNLKVSKLVVARPCSCQDTLHRAFGSRIQRWLCGLPERSDPNPCVGAGGAGLVCHSKLIGLLVGLVPFHDLANCEYSGPTTSVSCDNHYTVPVFLDLCPFNPWFRYLYDGLPEGPINCSTASSLYSSLYVLFIIVITTLIENKLQV